MLWLLCTFVQRKISTKCEFNKIGWEFISTFTLFTNVCVRSFLFRFLHTLNSFWQISSMNVHTICVLSYTNSICCAGACWELNQHWLLICCVNDPLNFDFIFLSVFIYSSNLRRDHIDELPNLSRALDSRSRFSNSFIYLWRSFLHFFIWAKVLLL